MLKIGVSLVVALAFTSTHSVIGLATPQENGAWHFVEDRPEGPPVEFDAAPPDQRNMAKVSPPYAGHLIARPLQIKQLRQRGLSDEEAEATLARARARLQARAVRHHPAVDEFILPTAEEDVERVVEELMGSGDYQYVAPDYLYSHADIQIVVPDDPQFGNQWHLHKIQAPLAWSMETGAGSNVVVGIVDSGVAYDHPDLEGLVQDGWHRPYPPLDGDCSLIADLDLLPAHENWDVRQHGTAMAGVATALGNNGTSGVGVAWGLPIMPVYTRFEKYMIPLTGFGSGFSIETLTHRARWAAEQGAMVVNMSFGGSHEPSVGTTGEYIEGLGSLLVWSAGNSSQTHNIVHEHVIVVGATDRGDASAWFSNKGEMVDVVAPGVDIFTTLTGGDGSSSWINVYNNQWGYTDGTSPAAALVSGLAGLVWTANPKLTPAEVRQIIYASVDPVGPPGNNWSGHGRANAYRAVHLAMHGELPDGVSALAPITHDVHMRIAKNGTLFRVPALANDFDPNGGALDVLDFDTTSAAGGEIELFPHSSIPQQHRFVYSAPEGFVGNDSFTYTVENAAGLSSSATVHIEVFEPFFETSQVFDFGTDGWPLDIALGDLNNNGWLDIVVPSPAPSTVGVLLTKGDGTFAEPIFVPSDVESTGVKLADLNGNGILDMVVTHWEGGSVWIYQGLGDGTFGEPAIHDIGWPVQQLQVLPLSDGGPPDIVVAGGTYYVFHNNGEGGFELHQTFSEFGMFHRGVAVGDLTGNGIPDVVGTSSNYGRDWLLPRPGDGAGGFGGLCQLNCYPNCVAHIEVRSVGPFSWWAAAVDLNNNGHNDLVTTNSNGWGSISVALNSGNGDFEYVRNYPTGRFPRLASVGDFTGNGFLDVIVPNLGSHSVSLLPNDGDGGFPEDHQHPVISGVATGPRAVAVGDINNNGLMDVVVANLRVISDETLHASVAIMLNQGEPTPGTPLGDLNGDGVVDVSDLLILLAAWGPCGDPNDCPADLNEDGSVDVSDLLILLSNWG